VQLQWTPLDWGRAAREREALDVERELVDVEERRCALSSRGPPARSSRPWTALSRTLAVDDSIITLRAEVLRETTARTGRAPSRPPSTWTDRPTC
jgi:hypothetical protein